MAFFHELPVGQTFRQLGRVHESGPIWRKRSSRTAELDGGKPGAGPLGRRWVHFGAQEQIVEVRK